VERPGTVPGGLPRDRRSVEVFDLSITKLLVLGVLALLIFGPDQLPKMASQFGRALRDLRHMAEKARTDLTENLGPEFRDFDINDLNPKAFVRKHLLDEFDVNGTNGTNGSNGGRADHPMRRDHPLPVGQRPPFDSEAT
jgi:sec-independent protein translocase protein TatB